MRFPVLFLNRRSAIGLHELRFNARAIERRGRRRMRARSILLAVTAAAFTACSAGGGTTTSPSFQLPSANTTPNFQQVRSTRHASAMVYTLSNGSSRNSVDGYARHDGRFRHVVRVDTQGLGDPQIGGQVQGAIAVGKKFLFAVDAGSNEISSFRVSDTGLTFVAKTSSHGTQPVSLTVHDDLLYVLNAGSSAIAGFRIDTSGRLHAIRNSRKPLSGANAVPAEISFDPSGSALVVTERMTNKIDVYSVTNGIPSGPTVNPSAGITPFGFAFAGNTETMVVADAVDDQHNAGEASSYSVATSGTLTVVSGRVADQNTAPCWVAVTSDGRIAYISNTLSDTISSYKIDAAGALKLTTNGSTPTEYSPSDVALSPDGSLLFVINFGSRTLGVYSVESSGKLDLVEDTTRLPLDAVGLVAL